MAMLREEARKATLRKRRKLAGSGAVVVAQPCPEAGKDGKQTKFRGMVTSKEACKAVQSRLCQASPGSQIAEARRAQLKRKAVEEDAVVDVGTGAAVAAEGCPPDILQRGKSSREYRTWCLRQWRRKRRAAADRGDAVAVAALLKEKQDQKQLNKQYYRRHRTDILWRKNQNHRNIQMAAVAAARVAAIAAGKMKDVGRMRKQELRAFAKSLGVVQAKFRGVVALKEACKAALSQ